MFTPTTVITDDNSSSDILLIIDIIKVMIIAASSAAVFFVGLIILVALMLLKRRNRQRKGKYFRFVLLFSYLKFVATIRLFRYHYFMEAIYWPSLISPSDIHWVCEKKTEDKPHHIAESKQGFLQKKKISWFSNHINCRLDPWLKHKKLFCFHKW